MKFDYQRGSIWFYNFKGAERSSLQRGYRPVVILSSLAGCMSTDFVMISPITSQLKQYQVNINIGKIFENGPESQVLSNQIYTVPKYDLSKPSGILPPEKMKEVETGLLISLGIAKPVAEGIKAQQEDLIEAKKDKERLESLIPEGEKLLNELKEVLERVEGRKKLHTNVGVGEKKSRRRTPEEIRDFIKEWEDKYNNKNEVALAFGFNTYSAAYQFYKYHKDKVSD